jgi:hypothetical protein
VSSAASCSECDAAASCFCVECGDDFCAAHSQQLHTLRRNQSHKVVALAEKAALLAAAKKREAKAQANKCAAHPDQIKYLYCLGCKEAICAVCVHGKHSGHGKIEIAEAAEQQRKELQAALDKISGDGGDDLHSLQSVVRLGLKLKAIKEGLSRRVAMLFPSLRVRQSPDSVSLTTSFAACTCACLALAQISSRHPPMRGPPSPRWARCSKQPWTGAAPS